MANCIAKATGIDGSRRKDVQRLGSLAAQASANTWNTFATVYVRANGSGEVEVKQNGETIHRFTWGSETESVKPPPAETSTPAEE